MKSQFNLLTLSFLFICLTGGVLLTAQNSLIPLNAEFVVDGVNLRNPLVGGLNAPQFCEVDFNNDGVQDLFVFDRTGDVVLTYLNEGTNNEVDYQYSPEYINNFPPLKHWVLLRDFNDDGAMDIFAYSHVPGIDGVQVYEGYYDGNELRFERFDFYNNPHDLIFFPLSSGNFTQLYVSTEDYPEVSDIDYDGDLDFITFSNGGGYIYLYENKSVDLGFGKDSLIYELDDTCLGGGYESGLTGCVSLSSSPDSCYTGFMGGGDERHAGSTLLMFDEDNDQDKEMWLGDVNTPTVNMLHNGGTNQQTWWSTQDCDFPSYDVSVEVFNFPANFYLDVDNDGKKDFIVAPNADKNSEDDQNVWFYKNTTDNLNPVFAYQKSTLFVEDMLDMGTGSRPVFVDYNADGLMDIIVGNETYYVIGGAKDARLFLYQNTGSASNPVFELVDDDYLGMSQFSGSNWSFAPAAGDIDGDGDVDLLVGEEFGALFFLENVAGPNTTFQFASPQFNYMGIDVGLVSTPSIIDLNRDGLMDIVVGERNGFLNYFENVGNIGNPQFGSDEDLPPNNSFLGQVDTRTPGSVEGYASPYFVDFEGDYMLFCGSNERGVIRYTNIDDNLSGAFTWDEDFFGNVATGIRTHPTLADVTSNNVLDLLIGNRRGGLSGYISGYNADGTLPVFSPDPLVSIDLFPNPASDLLTVQIDAKGTLNQLKMKAYNSIGQLIFEKECTSLKEEISLNDWSAGVYFLEVGNDKINTVKRFVKYN